MFADKSNVAVLAAAGSRKTQQVVDAALSMSGQVLITTYTNENLKQIERRIAEANAGVVPSNIHLLSWFSFLITHGAKPYQSSVLGEINILRGLNFDGEPSRYTPRAQARRYFADKSGSLYRKNLANFVVESNLASDGAVAKRLSNIFEAILVDELQDLAGWDLEVLDMLFQSKAKVLLVGDPRQHTYATNRSSKHKKYRGAGIAGWIDQRADVCQRTDWTDSYRCNQLLCDYADQLYPELPPTTSVEVEATDHDGVFLLSRGQVADYVKQWQPVVLRPSVKMNVMGLPAINIGVSKGSTYDRVLIFASGPMKKFAQTLDLTQLKVPAMLYVAVTRSRHSAAIVV